MTGWDLAPARLSPHASVTWAVGIAILWAGLWLAGPVWLWLRARRRAQAARRAGSGHTEDGLVVLSGVVATDGNEPAVTIAIDQSGIQRRAKRGYFVEWKEVRRTVTAHPFHVVEPGGQRVRVEPDQRVFLVDKLETSAREGATRVRSATLTNGEPVHVIGVLESGFDNDGPYRDAVSTRVLRPERGGRMLISTEPLADRHKKRARFHGYWAAGMGLFCAGLYLMMFGSFLALHRHGRVVTGTVGRPYIYYTHDKSGTHTHSAIAGLYPGLDGDRPFDSEVRPAIFRRMEPGVTVQLVVWQRMNLVQLGDAPTAPEVAPMLGLLFWFSLLPVYFVFLSMTRPWYDRSRLNENEPGTL